MQVIFLPHRFMIRVAMALAVLTTASAGQQKPRSDLGATWDALVPQIKAALNCSMPVEYGKVMFMKIADVAGDGTTMALIDYCQMGAYTDQVALMRLEDGKPVTAKFGDAHGQAMEVEFLEGASAMHGAGVDLIPEKHAIYKVWWDAGQTGFQLAGCRATAYVWDPHSKTFLLNRKLSDEMAKSECEKVARQMKCADHPCVNKSQ